MHYAGFWMRFLAGIIDALILSLTGPFAPLTAWLYYAFFTSSSWQATPGMRAMELKIVGYDGQPIKFSTATVRYFSSWLSAFIFMIGYLMIAFTARKQGLHDKIAHTLVIRPPHS